MLRIIIFVIAISAGCLAAWLALTMRSSDPVAAPAVAAPSHVPTEDVLIATADLPQGQALDDAKVRWQPWPKDTIHSGFITRSRLPDASTALTGSIVRSYFVSGEPIREEKLARGNSGLLAAILTPGKRAIAIRVTAESAAGGFILPNDHVDVIQTMTRQSANPGESLSRTLLSNVRVLAVDQKADEAKNDPAIVGKTVTLELSPAQTEIIATGQATGALSLTLRSFADSEGETGSGEKTNKNIRILRAGHNEIVRTQ